MPIQEARPLNAADAISSSSTYSTSDDSMAEEERFQLIMRLEREMAPVIEEPSSDPAYAILPPQDMNEVSS